MIYDKNRISSISESVNGTVDENYMGIGALYFMEECAEDELQIFASAIASDSEEYALGESADSYSLTALNEGFIETAKNKIKDIMTKFINWIESVYRSAYANLQTVLIKGNATLVRAYKTFLSKKKNTDFEFEGDYLNGTFDINEFWTRLNKEQSNSDKLESVSDAMKDYVKSGKITKSVVDKQVELLEGIGKNMKDLKSKMDNAKKVANDKIKAAKNAKYDTKEAANEAVNDALNYKKSVQRAISFSLDIIKNQAKVARKVINKAIGAKDKKKDEKNDSTETVKEESAMLDFMYEADMYELDEALESCAKHEECDDCDDDDDDFEDED